MAVFVIFFISVLNREEKWCLPALDKLQNSKTMFLKPGELWGSVSPVGDFFFSEQLAGGGIFSFRGACNQVVSVFFLFGEAYRSPTNGFRLGFFCCKVSPPTMNF